MVTKYVRESARDRAPGSHRHVIARPGVHAPTLKHRLLIVYLGIGLFSMMLLAVHLAGLLPKAGWGPPEEGSGVIVKKTRGMSMAGGELFMLTISLNEPHRSSAEDRKMLGGSVPTDKANWDSVSEGQVVQLRFQRLESGNKIRILRVALDE